MEQEQPDNDKKIASCVGSITEAYLIAASIYEQKKEIERFAKSKHLINKNSSHGRHIARKTESTILKLESVILELKKRLKALEKDIIENVTNKTKKAIESKSIMDETTISSDLFWDKESLGLKQELEEIERIKKRIDKLKVDKLDHTKDIQNIVNRANNTINSLFESDNKAAELDCNQNILTLEKLLQKVKQASSNEFYELLIDEVNHKILGTQQHGLVDHSIEKTLLVKESVNNYLGEKLLSHLMDNRSDIYPEGDERIKSLQVRDIVINKPKSNGTSNSRLKKMLIKTKKMNRESDEMVLWCDTVLKSWSVKSVFRNLDYVNHLTKNHKQVLDVVSDPWGDIKQSIKEKTEREKNLSDIDIIDSTPTEESTVGSPRTDMNLLNPLPPPEIKLYSEDKNLSATLATSLAEYTKQLYFSDLIQRVEELEKKIQ